MNEQERMKELASIYGGKNLVYELINSSIDNLRSALKMIGYKELRK